MLLDVCPARLGRSAEQVLCKERLKHFKGSGGQADLSLLVRKLVKLDPGHIAPRHPGRAGVELEVVHLNV
jgi:hypothetical protein